MDGAKVVLLREEVRRSGKPLMGRRTSVADCLNKGALITTEGKKFLGLLRECASDRNVGHIGPGRATETAE